MTFASPLRITTGVLLLACSLCGCIGGQTGDDAPGSDDAVSMPAGCEPSGIAIGIDQRLPAGYRPRDLLDRVADARVQAFVWSSESALRAALQNAPRGTILPEHADAETEVRVQTRYDGGPTTALLRGCFVEFVLRVTLTIEAADGSIDREVRGFLSGRPDEVIFQADADQRPSYDATDRVACSNGPAYVMFARDGTPRGVACDDDGRALLFPAACGGVAQTPLDERSTPELPVPREMLSMLSGRYATESNDDEPIAIDVAITAESDLACHDQDPGGNLSWIVPLAARFDWLDASIVVDMDASLVASQTAMAGGATLEVAARGCAELEGEALDFFGDQAGAQLDEASLCFFSRRTEDDVLELVLSVEGWDGTSDADGEVGAGWVLRPLNP